MATYTVILDVTILAVLGLTIMFCWKLNNKITELQSNKSEMVDFIKSLDATIINAHKSVVSLKEATQNAANEKQKYVEEGNALADDLSFMIDTGKRLISKVETSIENAKVLNESITLQISKLEKYKNDTKKRRRNKNKHSVIQNTNNPTE